MSYDGPVDNVPEAKIQKVKEYAQRIQEMLESARKAELEEARLQQEMRRAQEERDRQAAMRMDYIHSMPKQGVTELSTATMLMKRGGLFGMVKSAVSNTFQAATSVMYSKDASNARAESSPMMLLENDICPPEAAFDQLLSEPELGDMAVEEQKEAEAEPSESQEQSPEKQQNQNQDQVTKGGVEGGVVDYTKIPAEMEKKFEQWDENHALRPTIINVGSSWKYTGQKTLLSQPETKTYDSSVCSHFSASYFPRSNSQDSNRSKRGQRTKHSIF